MVDLIIAECMKLKRSRMLLISLLGGMVAPTMVFAALLKHRLSNEPVVFTYEGMFDQTNHYVLILFGIVVYGVIAAYLFSREYTERTLKSVLTIPVSKTHFLTAKLVMLLLWMLLLTVVAWLGALIFAWLGQADHFSLAIAAQSLQQYVTGCLLLYCTMTPFVFITLWMKSLVPTIIAAATVMLGNVAVSNEDLGAFFPWTGAYLVASGDIEKYSYSPLAALGVIAAVFVLGLLASYSYFIAEDVK